MQWLRPIYTCLALLTIAGQLDAAPITIATWNIRHLRSANEDGPAPRTDSDYQRLYRYAEQLDADVVALQEVEGPAAAKRVFSAERYNFFFTSQPSRMLTGFAVKKHVNVIQNPDYDRLRVNDETFSAADITVIIDDRTTLRLLAVHLKTGCWQEALSSDKSACRILSMQVGALERWIDARAAEVEPFIIMGDFNRRFDVSGDAFWAEISDGTPAGANLLRATEGKLDRCWGGRYPKYIDHIVLGRSASGWLVAGSFRQLVYTESAKRQNGLSDHCPISIIIDPALTGKHTEKDRILIKLDLIEQQLRDLRQMLEQER